MLDHTYTNLEMQFGGCILKKYMQANHGCQGYFPLFQVRARTQKNDNVRVILGLDTV